MILALQYGLRTLRRDCISRRLSKPAFKVASESLDFVITGPIVYVSSAVQRLAPRIEPATSRVENLSPSQRNACLVRLGFNAVAKTTQFSNHLSGPALRLCTTHSGTAFFITDSLMQNHPDETT